MSASTHLRGLVIAGALAAVALALAFFTLAMNKSASPAAAQPITRTTAAVTPTTSSAAKRHKPVVKPKPLDANLVAALKAGLPRSIANALASNRVAVIALTSANDPVAVIAAREAQSGATLAGASFAEISVDRDGDVSVLTSVLGTVPIAPATLIFRRPWTLFVTMPGFNDKTTVQQAAINVASAPAVDPSATPTITTATTTTPTTPAAAAVLPVGTD